MSVRDITHCHSYSDSLAFLSGALRLRQKGTDPVCVTGCLDCAFSSQTDEEKAALPFLKERSKKTQKKYDERQKGSFVDPAVEDQFVAGKLYGKL